MGVCVSVRVHFRNGLTCVQIRFVLSVTVIGEEAVLAWTATTALNGPRFRYKLRGGVGKWYKRRCRGTKREGRECIQNGKLSNSIYSQKLARQERFLDISENCINSNLHKVKHVFIIQINCL